MTDLTENVRPAVEIRPGSSGRTVPPGVALAIVLTGQIMAIIDVNIVNVAVPAMHATLGASGAGLQLIVAGYTIAYAVLLVTGARLGDILGHRRVYLAGVALFTVASLGCGLAPTTGVLIALRFVQGVGAAIMIPQVLSLIQRTYTAPGPRARAMSLYATVISGGAVLGQVLGGVLVSADVFGSSWRPVFLVNVPVGLLSSLSVGCFPRVASTGSAPLTCPASRCSHRPCWRSSCRLCSGSRSAGRGGAGPCWPSPSRRLPRSALSSAGWRRAAGSRSCLARC